MEHERFRNYMLNFMTRVIPVSSKKVSLARTGSAVGNWGKKKKQGLSGGQGGSSPLLGSLQLLFFFCPVFTLQSLRSQAKKG